MRPTILAITLTLLLAPPATASPPPGKYTCAEQGIVFDSIRVHGTRYRTDRGKGKLVVRPHRRLVGKSGPLRKWRGKWYWTRTHTGKRISEIRLRKARRVVFCSRVKWRTT